MHYTLYLNCPQPDMCQCEDVISTGFILKDNHCGTLFREVYSKRKKKIII